MLQLAGMYADICHVPPRSKMSQQKAREIVLAEARRHNRQSRITFAYTYIPLGPTDYYDRKDYGKHVEEASKNGFEYFITAFSMDGPPWEIEASSSKGTENYLNCLRDFASSFLPSYGKQSSPPSHKP